MIVGVGENGRNEIQRRIENLTDLKSMLRVDIIDHVEHSNALQLMKTCKILFIPYPENPFNAARFPIKALEYAASRRSIVCTDTICLNNIFSDEMVWFYDESSSESLTSILQIVEEQSSASQRKIENAFRMCESFTYDNRALNVLNSILRAK